MTSSADDSGRARVPAAAGWLGGAGFIPFGAASVALWAAPAEHLELAAASLVGYAAIILSFMGAVHWGLVIAGRDVRDPARWFALGVAPALVGWCALMVAPLLALVLLAAGFAAVYALDVAAVAAGLAPPWYRRLRTPLTVAVITALAAGALAVLVRWP